MTVIEYVLSGAAAVFLADPLIAPLGIPVTLPVLMTAGGLVLGILVGATPGLNGPFAMAVALPLLISIFGYSVDALLPVLGCLIGIMKGSTLGGAVPAILFNTPGTPDAFMTALDGYPMTRRGQSGKALRIAHVSSASGDTFSDLVLFTTAPFLAILVEAHLGFAEKAALVILSLSFISAVVGGSVVKGLMAAAFGMLCASIASGEDFHPRLTLDQPWLREGLPLTAVLLGVLVLSEAFHSLESLARERRAGSVTGGMSAGSKADNRLGLREAGQLAPTILRGATIGTVVGALPGIGSTLAATISYAIARKAAPDPGRFGGGAPEGVAATESANSAVSGANLIPVLSLGIPGNVAAVFILLAMDSIGGFNPGPAVFRIPSEGVNPELVLVFGLFTIMMLANILNWTVGGGLMRLAGLLSRVPKSRLLPAVILLALVSAYVERPSLSTILIALSFGVIGYWMRRHGFSVLAFIIAFILTGTLETTLRQAFAVAGGDPFFLLRSPISVLFLLAAVVVAVWFARPTRPRPNP